MMSVLRQSTIGASLSDMATKAVSKESANLVFGSQDGRHMRSPGREDEADARNRKSH
jgi:hypothetical protein